MVVVEVDPGAEFESGVLDGLEAVAPAELLLEGLDEALAESVLLGGVGGDVFLGDSVVADDGAVLARTKDQTVVMAQEHVFGGASQGAETGEESFLQGPFGRLGPSRTLESMAENFAGTAIDDGDKDAPPVTAAVDEGEVGGPALVGVFCNGTGDFDARAVAGTALGKGPALEFHDAVDFLDVDGLSLLVAKAAPGAAHATGRFLLVDLLDTGGHGFVQGLGSSLPGLVVGGGAWQSEPSAEFGARDLFARREQGALNLFHEFASGRGFPRISEAIL